MKIEMDNDMFVDLVETLYVYKSYLEGTAIRNAELLEKIKDSERNRYKGLEMAVNGSWKRIDKINEIVRYMVLHREI